MYQRKTVDRWDIMTNYGYGWECECSEYTRTEAKQRVKEYRENTRAAVRLEKHREPIRAEKGACPMYNDSVNLFAARLALECPGAGRISKKDIEAVIEAATGDPLNETGRAWERVHRSRLYRKQSGAYCRLLEYIAADPPPLFDFSDLDNLTADLLRRNGAAIEGASR